MLNKNPEEGADFLSYMAWKMSSADSLRDMGFPLAWALGLIQLMPQSIPSTSRPSLVIHPWSPLQFPVCLQLQNFI